MYEYHSEIKKLLDEVVDKNSFVLDKVIDLVSRNIINDEIIRTFWNGTLTYDWIGTIC